MFYPQYHTRYLLIAFVLLAGGGILFLPEAFYAMVPAVSLVYLTFFFLFCARFSFLRLSLKPDKLPGLFNFAKSAYCICLGQVIYLFISLLLIYTFVLQTQLTPRSPTLETNLLAQLIDQAWSGQVLISLPWVLFSLTGVGLSVFLYCGAKTTWIGQILVPEHTRFPQSFYFSYSNITTYSANLVVLMVLLSVASFLLLENLAVLLKIPSLSGYFLSLLCPTLVGLALFRVFSPFVGALLGFRFSLGGIFVCATLGFCLLLFMGHMICLLVLPESAFLLGTTDTSTGFLNQLSRISIQKRFTIFLVGWILVSAPLMGSWIARFSKYLTIAQSIFFSIILPISFILVVYKNTTPPYWQQFFDQIKQTPALGMSFSISLFVITYLIFRNIHNQSDLYSGLLSVSLEIKRRSLLPVLKSASLFLPVLIGGIFAVGWPLFSLLTTGVGFYLAITLGIFFYKAFIKAGGFA